MMIEESINEESAAIDARNELPARSRLTVHANTADLLKAHVTLMEREVILAQHVDQFRLVNRHYHALQSWHEQHTGWRVLRSATVIRLLRHVSVLTPGYLYERLREPGDFACLTWILWYAENRQLTGRGNEQQFLLSQLAEQLQEQSTSGADEISSDATKALGFDFRKPSDRYSIQRALHYLQDLGGVQLVDGQTREWVEQAPDADVLYEFTDVIHALVAALDLPLLENLADRLSEPAIALAPALLAEATHIPPLTRAWRTLLLGPALLRFDDPQAFSVLLTHADALADELLNTFGWLLEINRDYACIVRASGMATGPVTPLTPYGSNDQIALLLCTAMREQVSSKAWAAPDSYGCLHISTEDMAALLYTIRERYGEQWGNEARNKSSRVLLNEIYRKMRQVGLLRGPDAAGNLLILPTAARYAASYEKPDQETKAALTGKKANARSKIAAQKRTETNMKLPGIEQ